LALITLAAAAALGKELTQTFHPVALEVEVQAVLAQAEVRQPRLPVVQILEAAEAADKILTLEALAVPVLLLFVTRAYNAAQVALLHLLAAIPTIPSHLLALTQHKGKTHVTFCKSSRR